MHPVRIIELNIKVDEDVSLQKVDSPVDLLVFLGLEWRNNSNIVKRTVSI